MRIPEGYAKTSYGVCKIEKKLFTDLPGPDLGLATGDPDVRTYSLVASDRNEHQKQTNNVSDQNPHLTIGAPIILGR
jgi:hypothetical protein